MGTQRPAATAGAPDRLSVHDGLGIAAIVAIMVTTWWVEGMRVTLQAGLPWLAVLTVAYAFVRRGRGRDPQPATGRPRDHPIPPAPHPMSDRIA